MQNYAQEVWIKHPRGHASYSTSSVHFWFSNTLLHLQLALTCDKSLLTIVRKKPWWPNSFIYRRLSRGSWVRTLARTAELFEIDIEYKLPLLFRWKKKSRANLHTSAMKFNDGCEDANSYAASMETTAYCHSHSRCSLLITKLQVTQQYWLIYLILINNILTKIKITIKMYIKRNIKTIK